MKVFMLLVLAVVGVLNVTADHTADIAQNKLDCKKETNIEQSAIDEIHKRNFDTVSEAMKKYAFCFYQKAGLVDSNGVLNVKNTLANPPPNVDKAEHEKVVEICKDKKGANPEDSTFEIFKCYYEQVKSAQILL